MSIIDDWENVKVRLTPDQCQMIEAIVKAGDEGLPPHSVDARGIDLERFKSVVLTGLKVAHDFACSEDAFWTTTRTLAANGLELVVRHVKSSYIESLGLSDVDATDYAVSVGRILVDRSREYICDIIS